MIISAASTSARPRSRTHPRPSQVWDVVVIGVPDEEWGESVHAIVQPRPGDDLEPAEIAGFVREHLADYKKPRSIEIRRELRATRRGRSASASCASRSGRGTKNESDAPSSAPRHEPSEWYSPFACSRYTPPPSCEGNLETSAAWLRRFTVSRRVRKYGVSRWMPRKSVTVSTGGRPPSPTADPPSRPRCSARATRMSGSAPPLAERSHQIHALLGRIVLEHLKNRGGERPARPAGSRTSATAKRSPLTRGAARTEAGDRCRPRSRPDRRDAARPWRRSPRRGRSDA